MTRLLLADDHELFLKGLRGLLERASDLELLDTARDGQEALEKVELLRPDVVLMDMTMPRMNGIQSTQQISERFPGVRVLALSMHGDKRFIVESLKVGARGYVLKECSSQELRTAVAVVMAGHYYLAPSVMSVIVEDYLRLLDAGKEAPGCLLSDRELDVLKLLVEGCNAKQIANRLNISKNTVDTHRRHILDKVGGNSMAELTRYAIREGYLDLILFLN